MTISTTYAPVQYTGNAVTTAFSFPYPFFDNTDLLVYLNGVLQVSGYTVTGGSGASGTVTFSSAPANTVIVTISLSLPYTQLDNYVENQAFPADTLERGLDKAAIRDQQLRNSIVRALKYPDSVSGITDATLPTPVNGTALVFNGTTGAITTSTTYIADAVSAATVGVTGLSLITATSVTSRATTGTGSKSWEIQSGRGFVMGQRLRVASDDGTKINEGLVVSYTGTTLTINVDYVSGTGTHADWNISVAGDRGASGGGSGDMLASQNLNDVASKPTAFNTIKQAATDTNSGVVELATNAETIDGTDATRAVTPANIGYLRTTPPILRIQQVKANNIGGGQRTANGSWQASNLAGDVLLNTAPVTTNITGASLNTGTGVITLPAGTYKIRGWKQFYNTAGSRARFWNITDSAVFVLGSSAHASGSAGSDKSLFDDNFVTIAGIKTIRLETWVSGTSGGTSDLGAPASTGDTEVYGDFTFEKVA